MAAAQEAGLDPAEVRRAAALEVRRIPGMADVLLGAPGQREVSARLEGARIPADTRQVVRWAEETMGKSGKVVDSSPGTFTWRADGPGSRNRVTLAEREGALEVTVSTDRAGNYVGLLFVGLLAWAGLSIATPVGALPLLAKILGPFITPPLVVRPFWAATDRRLRERLETLALDILRLADERDPAAPSEGAAGNDPS